MAEPDTMDVIDAALGQMMNAGEFLTALLPADRGYVLDGALDGKRFRITFEQRDRKNDGTTDA